MTIKLLCVGKTDESHLKALIDKYVKRLEHYNRFEMVIIPDLKNTKSLDPAQQKEREGKEILAQIAPSDFVVLLDEKGKQFSSEDFAQFLQKRLNSGMKQLVLVIGGPYGFSPEVYQHAHQKLSLSKMTFSHQMVRLFLVEQLYRGFSILRNEPYHHR